MHASVPDLETCPRGLVWRSFRQLGSSGAALDSFHNTRRRRVRSRGVRGVQLEGGSGLLRALSYYYYDYAAVAALAGASF